MEPRPGTSQQTDKVETYEVKDVPYHPQITRAPTTYDGESNEDMFDTTWASAWNALCQLLNLLHHMMAAIIVFSIWKFALTSEANGSVSNLQLHMVFAGTGYQLFLVEAIMTLHCHNSWSLGLSRDSKQVVHGCLQLLGGLFVIAGTILALAEVDMVVTTAHGICGVVAFVFTLISMISGVVTLFSGKMRLVLKNGPVRIFHVLFALIGISMGLVTLLLGFNMSYFRASGDSLATALMLFTSLTLLYVLIQPIVNLVSTVRNTL